MDKSKKILFCQGLCGIIDCPLEFQQQIDLYNHTNKGDFENFKLSEQVFCRKCMNIYSIGEAPEDHKCKPMYPGLSNDIDAGIKIRNDSFISTEDEVQNGRKFTSLGGNFIKTAEFLENPESSEYIKHSSNISQEIVGIFWDIENIIIPDCKSPSGVVGVLRERFVSDKREVDFQCVCDTHKEERYVIDELNSSQVTIVHVACTNKNAADEKLKQLLVKFSNTYQTPATVVLLSGDVNFSPTLNSLKNYNKFHVVLVHNKQCSQALKNTASELHLFDDLIRNVDPPSKPFCTKSFYVLVSGLPSGLMSDWQIRNELSKLCDNTGGKIMSTEEGKALVRFQTPDHAARGQRRLNNQSFLGINISAKLEAHVTNFIDYPSVHGPQRQSFRYPFIRMTRPPYVSNNPRSIRHPSNVRHGFRSHLNHSQFRNTDIHSTVGNIYCLIFFPHVNRTRFEVITVQHPLIETTINKLKDILFVERYISLIDSVALFVRSNLNGVHLIHKIEQRNLDLKKVELYKGDEDAINFHGFIADAYLILSQSLNGWMFVKDFWNSYKKIKGKVCPPEFIDRILSNTKIVCGFKQSGTQEMSILANEDCDPNSFLFISDNISELELRNALIDIINEPQNKGRIHYFDLIPTLRKKFGNENICIQPKGVKIESLLERIHGIYMSSESKSGICDVYIHLITREPTNDEVNFFNIQIVKHMLIEKSNAVNYEMFNRIFSEIFYVKLKCSPSGLKLYEEVLSALENSKAQIVIAPKVTYRFPDILLLVKQEIWELTSFYGISGVELDVLEKEYQIKTGHNIPFRACYFNNCADLLACIPGLKLKKGEMTRVFFISTYFPEMIASQCVRLLNINPSQSLPVCEFRSLFEKIYEHSIGFQLEDISQISVRRQNDSRFSSVHLSLKYLGMEITHFLYQQPTYSLPLDVFDDEYNKFYNKHLYPSMFGVQNIIDLFTMLENYIVLEGNVVHLLQHRVFACEVCQVLRKLTHPDEPIFISQFHSKFLKIHFKELKLSNYNATKLSPLLLKIADVIQISDVRGDDRSLVLTGLGWYIPESCTSLPYSLRSGKPQLDLPKSLIHSSKTRTKINRDLLIQCENLLFSQPLCSCPTSEFNNLFRFDYKKPLNLKYYNCPNIVDFFRSFPEYFVVKVVGLVKTVQLTQERIFACECRVLLEFNKNGINLSNFAKEFHDRMRGGEFDLTRYGKYTKLTKLIAKVPDVISLIGPNKSWLVSTEYAHDLIEADRQVDISSLAKLIVLILIDGREMISFNQIPHFYERIHHCDAPEWISILLACPPLVKMYADAVVEDQSIGIEKLMKDKQVFFKLSSKKWEEIFKSNTICLFFRKNKMLISVDEFSESYKKDYNPINLKRLDYCNMEDLLSSRYLQLIQESEPYLVRLSAEGIQVLFQMQLVEILYNCPEYSLPFEFITSSYYNSYGYNLKLHEMGMTKLSNLLSSFHHIIHIFGDGKSKKITLRNDIIIREKCRQILTDLSMENAFPIKFELFTNRFNSKFKEKCSLQMLIDSGSNVVHILGQPGCYQIEPAIQSYPYRDPQNIPRIFISSNSDSSLELCKRTDSTLENAREIIDGDSMTFPKTNTQQLISTPTPIIHEVVNLQNPIKNFGSNSLLNCPLPEIPIVHFDEKLQLIENHIPIDNNIIHQSQTKTLDETFSLTMEPSIKELTTKKTSVDVPKGFTESKSKINLAAKFTLIDESC